MACCNPDRFRDWWKWTAVIVLRSWTLVVVVPVTGMIGLEAGAGVGVTHASLSETQADNALTLTDDWKGLKHASCR
jgi:hypothetical protein